MVTSPVFLLGKLNEQRSLVAYSLWGCNKSDIMDHARTYSNYKHVFPIWKKKEGSKVGFFGLFCALF